MKKIFILSALMAPMAAFALDTSDCETIGYWQSTTTTCQMYDDCIKFHQENPIDRSPEAVCANQPRTAEECAQQIAQTNAAAAKSDFLIKCPANTARLAHKNAEKTSSAAGRFVATDGTTEINIDDLIADNDFVYYAQLNQGIHLIAGRNTWRAIGPRDDDGLFLSIVK